MVRSAHPTIRRVLAAALLLAATPAAAREKVVVYTVNPETEVNQGIDEEFTRRSGIDVDLLVVPAVGTVATRIRAEKDHPRADVFASAPIDFMQSLQKEGLLDPYKAAAETPDFIKKGYGDPDGYWHGWFALTTCIFWNTNSFATDPALKGVKPPTSWDELLNPAFKGKVILSNPQTSAIGYVLLQDQIFRLGEQKAWDYTRKLNDNVAQYTPSAPLTVTLVEQGEGAVGAFWLANVLNSKIAHKQPVDFAVPQDNVVNIWTAAIVHGGPNPDAARKYVDFLQGDFAQAVNAKYGFRNPLNPGVTPPEGAPALASIKAVDYDMAKATADMGRVTKQWARETSQ